MSLYAIITGASQGIGRALALAFAGEPGVHLALISRNQQALDEVAKACQARGATATAFACDLTSEDEVALLAPKLGLSERSPDVLINNAGHFRQQEFFGTTSSDFRSSLESNLMSAFHMTQVVGPIMERNSGGTIFFMGSVASVQGYADSAAYCSAKHGLLGLARSARLALRPSGVRVTAILPGATDSPSWDSSEVKKERLMPAEDIAKSVLSIYKLTSKTVVEEIVLRPIGGDI